MPAGLNDKFDGPVPLMTDLVGYLLAEGARIDKYLKIMDDEAMTRNKDKKRIVTIHDDDYGCESGCTGVRVYIDNEVVGFEFDHWFARDITKENFMFNIAMSVIPDFNDHEYELDVDNSDLKDGGLY